MKLNPSLLIPSVLAMALTSLVVTGAGKGDEGAIAKIEAALPAKAPAAPKKPRRLLVFSVTNGFRHASIPTGQAAMAMLGGTTGAFEAVVSDDLANFEEGQLKTFDAVCFLNTTGDVFLPSKAVMAAMTAEAKAAATERAAMLGANLLAFVKNGGGFVGIHSATDTLYSLPEYGEMVGGYFDGHPWGAGTDVSIRVEKGQEAHPVVAGLEGKNLDFKEEIYQLKDPYDSGKLHLLLRLDTEKSPMNLGGIKRADKDYGVSWIRPWGKGRVFYCSLGHNDHIYQNPKVLEIYLAGTQWALGDLEVPVKVAD